MKELADILSANKLFKLCGPADHCWEGQDSNTKPFFVRLLELFCGRQEHAKELQRSHMRDVGVCAGGLDTIGTVMGKGGLSVPRKTK